MIERMTYFTLVNRERIFNAIGVVSILIVTVVVVWIALSITNAPPAKAVATQPIPPTLYIWQTYTPDFKCAVIERDGNISQVQCFPKEK